MATKNPHAQAVKNSKALKKAKKEAEKKK